MIVPRVPHRSSVSFSMKKSSGVRVSLLPCLFAFALLRHVQAGFCDDQLTGHYCRSYPESTSTFCLCTDRTETDANGLTKHKRDCDKVLDTRCVNGCQHGSCLRSDEVCADRTLTDMKYNDSTTTYTLKDMCPAVVDVSYRTWKNREQNSDGKFT